MMTLVMNEFGWPLPKLSICAPVNLSGDTMTTNTRSPLSFEGDAKINEQWFAHAGARYNHYRAASALPTAPSSIAARS